MLSSMVKEHMSKQVAVKEGQETKRKEACAAASQLTQALVDHLNVGVAQAYLNQKRVAQAYLNQKRLDAEAKQLHASSTNFAKQTQQWLNIVELFSSALKELGDVENWAKTIEGDVRLITNALENVYKDSQESTSTSQ
ncbi:GCN5-like protein 1 (GCN5L1) [Popillia japonica]|uniref:Biogenesis of lysosome-related organelles complex 1 subunit 1 n=1 Tax=Popillia japonica TaxID=7064 RepID=A0AAW1KI99_POPJA